MMSSLDTMAFAVALPTEGVDRNKENYGAMAEDIQVALPTEGVDRNGFIGKAALLAERRPPHGGRG